MATCGQREVRCTLRDEQARHHVADQAEEEGTGEAAAHDRRRQRARDEQPRQHDVNGDLHGLRPAGPPVAAEEQDAGDDHGREQDDAEVERQRARLGDGGGAVGQRVDAAQGLPVAVGGARHGGSEAKHAGQRRSGGVDDGAADQRDEGEDEREVDAVPHREVHRFGERRQ